MPHHLLLIGSQSQSLPCIALLSARGHTAATCTSAQEAGPLAGLLRPSALLLLGDIADLSIQQAIAFLLLHPSTHQLPLLCVSPAASATIVVQTLRTGVAAILPVPQTGSVADVAWLQKLESVIGTHATDDAVRVATDRRGVAILDRIGDAISALRASGRLIIDGLPAETYIRFFQGSLVEVSYAEQHGAAALTSIVGVPAKLIWRFRFLPPDEEVKLFAPDPFDGYSMEMTFDDSVPDAKPISSSISDLSMESVPLEESLIEISARPAFLPNPTDANLGQLPRPRILLIDTDIAALAQNHLALCQAGFDVATVHSSAVAFEFALSMRPDAVVSELAMSDMDGWSLLTQLREDSRLRHCGFVFLSSNDDYLHILEQNRVGADGYVVKRTRRNPIGELSSLVRQSIQKRRAFQAVFAEHASFAGAINDVGVVPLLLMLGEKAMSGTLFVEDGFAFYRIFFQAGIVLSADVRTGNTAMHDREALIPLLLLDYGDFWFEPTKGAQPPTTLNLPPLELCDAMAVAAKERREQVQESMFREDHPMLVDGPLFGLYRTLIPSAQHVVIDALQRGIAPRQLLLQGIASPLLVEWTVKDLLRKGVGHFTHSAARVDVGPSLRTVAS